MAEILIVIFTGVVALCTLLYCGLTGWLAWETRQMRRVQTEPRVSIRLEFNEQVGSGLMDLVIRNEGQGLAEDIQFQFKGDPTYFDSERPIDMLPAIKNGLKHLSAGQSFRIHLGWLFGDQFTRAIEEPWVIDLCYKNATGKSVSDSFVIDFSQFSELMLMGAAPLKNIEKHLQEIQKDIHFWTTGFYKLHVLTQTEEEYRKERAELMQRHLGSNKADNPNPRKTEKE